MIESWCKAAFVDSCIFQATRKSQFTWIHIAYIKGFFLGCMHYTVTIISAFYPATSTANTYNTSRMIYNPTISVTVCIYHNTNLKCMILSMWILHRHISQVQAIMFANSGNLCMKQIPAFTEHIMSYKQPHTNPAYCEWNTNLYWPCISWVISIRSPYWPSIEWVICNLTLTQHIVSDM